ncbi:MAG: prepilin-type N-terminal cleavage/methylation domain-containing protein [Archangiaceae bacterium]|nr:prepilin-type N-terminal cleavage/methylation domain-containing protein [Archangiaceae bacterium]
MRRRGFTLIEVILALAITGVLAAMAAYSLTAVNTLGRVNGGAQSLANILRNARAHAIMERCTYVVQINGPLYNPLTAPPDVPRQPNTVIVWRKNDCRSTVAAYVPGLLGPLEPQRDRRVNDFSLNEFQAELVVTNGVITEPANRLMARSISIGWLGDGTRTVWADDDSDGTSLDTGMLPGAALTLTVRQRDGAANPNRVVNIPGDGPAVAP